MIIDKYNLDVHPDLLESVVDYINERNIENHPLFSKVDDTKKMFSMINEILFNQQTDTDKLVVQPENQKRALEMLEVTHNFSKRLEHPNQIFNYKGYFQKMFG